MTRVGINGFGRIGRLAVRALRHHPELQLVHINEISGGAETAAHLLPKNLKMNVIEALSSVSNYDGVHRPIPEECFYAMMNDTSVN